MTAGGLDGIHAPKVSSALVFIKPLQGCGFRISSAFRASRISTFPTSHLSCKSVALPAFPSLPKQFPHLTLLREVQLEHVSRMWKPILDIPFLRKLAMCRGDIHCIQIFACFLIS